MRYEQYAYDRAAQAGRRGMDLDEIEECQHIFGCSSPGTIPCDCGELICEAHIIRCPDCDLQVCQGGCSITSADDMVRRCYGCHHEHEVSMKEKREAA